MYIRSYLKATVKGSYRDPMGNIFGSSKLLLVYRVSRVFPREPDIRQRAMCVCVCVRANIRLKSISGSRLVGMTVLTVEIVTVRWRYNTALPSLHAKSMP